MNIIASNPFFSSFVQSDLFGKFIFLALFFLSIISWSLLIHKILSARAIRRSSAGTQKQFESSKHIPLSIQFSTHTPFSNLYSMLKQSAAEVLTKNQANYLSSSDIDLVSSHVETAIANEAKALERHLFVLPTAVSLAPFLGLLGTVWGILIALGELEGQSAGANQAVLGGISMALGTTVLGLLVAIPPLVGYNYLKAVIRDYRVEMHNFAADALAAVELQYRKVDLG